MTKRATLSKPGLPQASADTLATSKAHRKDTGHRPFGLQCAAGNVDRWSESLRRVTRILVDRRMSGPGLSSLFRIPFMSKRRATTMVRKYAGYPGYLGVLRGNMIRHVNIDKEAHAPILKLVDKAYGALRRHAVVKDRVPFTMPCADGSMGF